VLASVGGLDRFQEETKTLTFAYFPSRSNEEINAKPPMAASTLLATFFLFPSADSLLKFRKKSFKSE